MGKMTNQELVEKAVITANDIAAAGKLNPKQAEKFIDYVIDITALKGHVRVERFGNEQMYIEKIGVGNRVAVPKAEAVDPGVRRGIVTSRVTLEPKDVMVPVEVGDNFLDWNVEGEDVQDTLMRMFATQLANDMEEFYINGNTLGPARIEDELFPGGSTTQVIKDAFIALADGWLKLADGGHIVDAQNDVVSSDIFSAAIKQMPDKFKRVRRDMRFIAPSDLEQDYRNKVSTRATAAGDVALSTTQNLTPFGVELVPVPLLPEQPRMVEHVSLSAAAPTVVLAYKPIASGSVIVTPATLGSTPVTPYIEGTDYSIDYVNGSITRIATGAIGDPEIVKVTYLAEGAQFLLTHFKNLILAIGRDIRIEKDRDIFRGVNQFALTVRAAPQVEEVDAIVKVKNVKAG